MEFDMFRIFFMFGASFCRAKCVLVSNARSVKSSQMILALILHICLSALDNFPRQHTYLDSNVNARQLIL